MDEATIGLLDEHTLSLDELGRRYCTSLDAERPEHSQGMNPDRAEQVLSMVGPNELSPPPSEPAWVLFLKELTAPLNLMLICAALLCILVSDARYATEAKMQVVARETRLEERLGYAPGFLPESKVCVEVRDTGILSGG